LLLAAAVLGWRRLAGALTQPLEAAPLLVVAAVLVMAAAALRLGRRALTTSDQRRWADPFAVVTSAAVVLVAFSLSLPGTSWSSLAVFWLAVAAEEAWAWWRRWGRGTLSFEPLVLSEPGRVGPESGRHAPARTANPPASMAVVPLDVENGLNEADLEEASEGLEDAAFDADEPPGEDVTQQLTGSQAADGSETLVGWLRVALAARQRNTNVHVAFCPPFARTPEVTVEQLDGPETRIKVVQVLPYGVRCDLKLAGTSVSPASVLLQLSAHAEPGPRPAAIRHETFAQDDVDCWPCADAGRHAAAASGSHRCCRPFLPFLV